MPIAPDPLAGIAVLRAISPSLRLLHDDGQDRRRAVCRRRRGLEGVEPGLHFLMGYHSNPAPFEKGQDLPAKIHSVHLEGPRFPTTAIPSEDFGGDRLEQGFAMHLRTDGPTVAESREHRPGPCARFRLGHGACVASDFPYTPTQVLTMDEVALRTRWHHPDAVSLQFGVPDVTDGAGVPEGIHPALREANSGHDGASSVCCIRVRIRFFSCPSCTTKQIYLIINHILRTEGVLSGVVPDSPWFGDWMPQCSS